MIVKTTFDLLDILLLTSMFITVIISGWLTYVRIMYNIKHVSYDSWIFGMNLAMLLNYFDTDSITN